MASISELLATLDSLLGSHFFTEEMPPEEESSFSPVLTGRTHRILVVNVHKARGRAGKEERGPATTTAIVVDGVAHVASGQVRGANPKWESEFAVDLGLDDKQLRSGSLKVCVLDAASGKPMACADLPFDEVMKKQPQVIKAHWRPLGRTPAAIAETVEVAWDERSKVRQHWPTLCRGT
jgi:hypothetical protein